MMDFRHSARGSQCIERADGFMASRVPLRKGECSAALRESEGRRPSITVNCSDDVHLDAIAAAGLGRHCTRDAG